MTPNIELKALTSLVFDGVKTVEDLIAKSQNLPADLAKVFSDVPATVENFSDLKDEIASFSDSSHRQDLIAFLLAEVSGVTSDTHPQGIVDAVIQTIADAVNNGISLYKAIKG